MPKISVVVPVYNAEPYIHRCVDSILSQSFNDFELILIDDGSPDNCPAICDEYAKIDSRIHVIHQYNGGLSAARNAGIDWAFANSNSEWITFIDSDDWVHKQYLDLLHHAVISESSDIGACRYIKTNNIIEQKHIQADKALCFKPEMLYIERREFATLACCKLYNKKLFSTLRFPLGKLHEDVYLTYKINFQANTIAFVDEELYYYFNNINGITRSEWTPKRLDELEAHRQQLQFLKKSPYKNAYKLEINSYLWVLSNHIKEANAIPQKHKLIKIKLLLKLKFVLIRYYKLTSFKKTPWAFELAYPLITRVYWKLNKMSHNK